MGVVGLFPVRFDFNQEFGVSIWGLSAFLPPLAFSLTFGVVTVHVKSLAHTHISGT